MPTVLYIDKAPIGYWTGRVGAHRRRWCLTMGCAKRIARRQRPSAAHT